MEDHNGFTFVLHVFERETGTVYTRKAGEPTADKQRHTERASYIGDNTRNRVFFNPNLAIITLRGPKVASVTPSRSFKCIFKAIKHRRDDVPARRIRECVPWNFIVFAPMGQVAA